MKNKYLNVSKETHQIAIAEEYFNLHNCEQASTEVLTSSYSRNKCNLRK